MKRAAVLIGVSSTGGLPELQAVQSGIEQMRVWAAGQGIKDEFLIVRTDQDGKVRAHEVADAIHTLVKRRDLDQLVVYFSGHGLHNEGDVWLLSGAPEMGAEAVNVEGSIKAARTCGISHVVFMADACRTAADSIQALGVKGIEIFPNDPVDGLERPVDAYFACARGKPALEVRDPFKAAQGFSGIYTEVLSECLDGKCLVAVDLSEEDGVALAHVSAWKLADRLLAEVPARLKAKLGKTATVNQTPVARITSRNAWISRLLAAQLLASSSAPPKPAVDVLGGQHLVGEANAVDTADSLLGALLAGRAEAIGNGLLGDASKDEQSGGALLMSTACELAAPFRPNPADPVCGFKLRGARVRAVHGGAVRCAIVDAKATRVGVEAAGAPASVLLELADGRGVLLPALARLTAELTFLDGELMHLTYDVPQAQYDAAHIAEQPVEVAKQAQRKAERTLLASIGASAGLGVLRLNDSADAQLTDMMDSASMLDPVLALYMAYLYYESGQPERVRGIAERLQRERGFIFYDLALLSGGERLASAQQAGQVWPFVPMLSRGWALLAAFNAPRPPRLQALQRCLLPSMWTLFNAAGTAVLAKAIDAREIYQ